MPDRSFAERKRGETISKMDLVMSEQSKVLVQVFCSILGETEAL